MCHAALNCAVRYCIVDQAVLGVRILTELIWILSSSCLNAELGLPAVETRGARGALDQLEHKIRFSSEALARDILTMWPRERTDRSAAIQDETNCIKTTNDTNRDEGRTDPTRSETRQSKTGKSRIRFGSPS